MYSHPKKIQQGFSLIELMIAMLIGLFLMGGVVNIYLSSSLSSKSNTGLRTMQENGRYALATLKNSIQMSGYIAGYSPGTVINPFPAASDSALTIRYQNDIDCTGASTLALPSPNTGFVQDIFQITTGALTCTSSAGGGTQTIVDGVDQMRILYGIDDDDNGIADRYVNAATVTGITNGWRDKVSSVRIALLMNSITNVKSKSEAKTYTLLDTTSTLSDRMMRKVFTTTILVRNRMT